MLKYIVVLDFATELPEIKVVRAVSALDAATHAYQGALSDLDRIIVRALLDDPDAQSPTCTYRPPGSVELVGSVG